ncbi:MAG TPA: cation diffusion facilitator family transporter [Anaerolineaceae bacterium]|jgi:cobalt-zinc-cadmium efflux system protein
MKSHQSQIVENRFLLSIGITIVVFFAELIGGFWSGSLALLSDSAHVFMDIFALGLSFAALRLSNLPEDDGHTYGYHRFEVLAALANGLTLLVISVGIFYESYQRWMNPEPVKSTEMLVIAVIGLVANLLVAFVLGNPTHSHSHAGGEEEHAHRDLNVESAFLHVLGDAVSSVGVIIAGVLIWRTGLAWIDPLVSVLIGLIILLSSGRVLRSSLHILIEGTPEGISVAKVGESLSGLPGVVEVHDLHVWNICSGTVALSAHLVLAEPCSLNSNETLVAVNQMLAHQYGIEHTTVQVECETCGQGRVYQR